MNPEYLGKYELPGKKGDASSEDKANEMARRQRNYTGTIIFTFNGQQMAVPDTSWQAMRREASEIMADEVKPCRFH